jgi:hypothetical protein
MRRRAAPNICGAAVADEDWVARGAQQFPLLFAGRFAVHGGHLRPPPGRTAEDNGVGDRVRTCLGDGFAAAEIAAGAPYDLICANILANPLRQMAPQMARHLAPDGLVILSGLLTRQEAEVAEAYRGAGLRLADQIRLGDWSTLLLTA